MQNFNILAHLGSSASCAEPYAVVKPEDMFICGEAHLVYHTQPNRESILLTHVMLNKSIRHITFCKNSISNHISQNNNFEYSPLNEIMIIIQNSHSIL